MPLLPPPILQGLIPIVGAAREAGTSMLIEDVACPVDKLADMMIDLIDMFQRYGYHDASCFGHALEGNLHLVFSQVCGEVWGMCGGLGARQRKRCVECAFVILLFRREKMCARLGSSHPLSHLHTSKVQSSPPSHSLLARASATRTRCSASAT